jgi:hypothetical protein
MEYALSEESSTSEAVRSSPIPQQLPPKSFHHLTRVRNVEVQLAPRSGRVVVLHEWPMTPVHISRHARDHLLQVVEKPGSVFDDRHQRTMKTGRKEQRKARTLPPSAEESTTDTSEIPIHAGRGVNECNGDFSSVVRLYFEGTHVSESRLASSLLTRIGVASAFKTFSTANSATAPFKCPKPLPE